MTRNITLVISVFALMGAYGCGSRAIEPYRLEKKPYCLDESFLQRIEFTEPELRQVVEGIPLTGSVETNPDKVIHFVSLVGGVIANTHFSLGDRVEKGQVLVELLSTELSSLQSELKTIESQIQVSEKNLQAVQSMYDDGISSERDLMESRSELNILRAAQQKVVSHLNLYSASPEKGVFQIKAPAAGIITSKSIAAGMQIAAEGDPLFTISDLSEVWVLANIYATNIQNIETGMSVQIETLSYPDEVFAGKVAAISQVFDEEAKVLKARVVLQNPGLKLKPGMLVDVIALKQQNTVALSIPTQVLVFDDNRHHVVVYKSECEIEIRPVELLSKSNGICFISSGLSGGERIISRNQLLVYEKISNFEN